MPSPTRVVGLIAIAATAVTVACGKVVPPPQVVALGTPVELPHAFLRIDCVVELSDGRVLVLDGKGKRVQLADFSSQEVTTVGDVGAAPGEYAAPTWLLPLPGPGDTTWIDDPGNDRYDVVVNGQITDVSIPRDPRAPLIRGFDKTGRAYAQPEINGDDSIPVVRVDRKSHAIDTAAFLNTGLAAARAPHMFVLQKLPSYPHNDTWGVLPDGTVLLARMSHFHIEAVGLHGKHHLGTRIAYAPIGNTWGDTEPPFVSAPAPREDVSPDGLFWVERTTPDHEQSQHYYVFDVTGRLVREVALPLGARLVGFGQRYVYSVRTEPAGAQYLERSALPGLAGSR